MLFQAACIESMPWIQRDWDSNSVLSAVFSRLNRCPEFKGIETGAHGTVSRLFLIESMPWIQRDWDPLPPLPSFLSSIVSMPWIQRDWDYMRRQWAGTAWNWIDALNSKGLRPRVFNEREIDVIESMPWIQRDWDTPCISVGETDSIESMPWIQRDWDIWSLFLHGCV